MKLMNRALIACLIAALTLTVTGWFVLPDVLVVQLGADGAGRTLPKPAALLIPLAIEALAFGLSRTDGKRAGALVTAAAGIVMYAFTFIVNL